MNYTLILTMHVNGSVHIHSISGFASRELADEAGDKWMKKASAGLASCTYVSVLMS